MTGDLFPREFVPKVQPSRNTDQQIFARNDRFPYLQVKFHDSYWLLDEPRDVLLAPRQRLILTSWEEDKYLLGRQSADEFERLKKLEHLVDVYFAHDRWTYDNGMGSREILKEIERSVTGQKILKRMVDDAGLDVTLYPLITGWKRWHYEHNRELFEVFETSSCGFDATGYNSKPQLINDLNRLVDTLAPERIYLNGCISPNWLLDVPREVVAFSGKHTLLEEARVGTGEHDQDIIYERVDDRIQVLYNIQSELSDFGQTSVTGD